MGSSTSTTRHQAVAGVISLPYVSIFQRGVNDIILRDGFFSIGSGAQFLVWVRTISESILAQIDTEGDTGRLHRVCHCLVD